MNFDHCVFVAASRAIDLDDMPEHLLPLVIVSEVARVAGLESDALRARSGG